MFLTSHTLIALSSTKFINDPASLFFINFFLHYVFDSIPHGEEGGITKGLKSVNKNLSVLVVLDLTFVITLSIFFYQNYNNSIPTISSAVIGAILPDFLWGIYRITNWKFFELAERLNIFSHKLFDIKQKSVLFYSTQIIPILIFLLSFYNF